jgi:hypothetical protein
MTALARIHEQFPYLIRDGDTLVTFDRCVRIDDDGFSGVVLTLEDRRDTADATERFPLRIEMHRNFPLEPGLDIIGSALGITWVYTYEPPQETP